VKRHHQILFVYQALRSESHPSGGFLLSGVWGLM
jgi:hypothetical protein